jgi:hypothetical protein
LADGPHGVQLLERLEEQHYPPLLTILDVEERCRVGTCSRPSSSLTTAWRAPAWYAWRAGAARSPHEHSQDCQNVAAEKACCENAGPIFELGVVWLVSTEHTLPPPIFELACADHQPVMSLSTTCCSSHPRRRIRSDPGGHEQYMSRTSPPERDEVVASHEATSST